MTDFSTDTPDRQPAWIALVAAIALVLVGAFFILAQLDPFVGPALLPLVVVLTLVGRHARRHGECPYLWPYWLLAAFVVGLLIYAAEYWIYGVTHPPMPAAR